MPCASLTAMAVAGLRKIKLGWVQEHSVEKGIMIGKRRKTESAQLLFNFFGCIFKDGHGPVLLGPHITTVLVSF